MKRNWKFRNNGKYKKLGIWKKKSELNIELVGNSAQIMKPFTFFILLHNPENDIVSFADFFVLFLNSNSIVQLVAILLL